MFRIVFKKSVALFILFFYLNILNGLGSFFSFLNKFVFLGQAKSHLKSSQVNEVPLGKPFLVKNRE